MEAVSTHVRILWVHSTVAVTLDIYYNHSSSVWVGSELGDIWCLFFFSGRVTPELQSKNSIKELQCQECSCYMHLIIRLCNFNQFWICNLELCEMAVLLFYWVMMYITNIMSNVWYKLFIGTWDALLLFCVLPTIWILGVTDEF